MGKHAELYRQLADLVRSGQIDGQAPAEVLDMNPAFKDINVVTFRSKLREIRRMMGKPLSNGTLIYFEFFTFFWHVLAPNANDDHPSTEIDPTPLVSGRDSKRPKLLEAGDADGDKTPASDANLGEAQFDGDLSTYDELRVFQPIYVMGVWEDEREEQRVTVAIHMPSGSFERPREFDLQVIEDGNALELTYVWPKCMTDPLYLHKAEIDLDKTGAFKQHPRVLSFRPFLRKLRARSDHSIASKCVIKLPFTVKAEIAQIRRRQKALGWRTTGQRVLYVTMEAPDKDYKVENDQLPQVVIA